MGWVSAAQRVHVTQEQLVYRARLVVRDNILNGLDGETF